MLAPTRRTFLTLGVLAGAQLVCGCTDGGHTDGDHRKADPDLPLRARAVAATDTLLAAYDAVLAGPGAAKADLLRSLRGDVVKHRAALAVGLPSPSPSAPPSASVSPSVAGPGSVAALAAAERQTAGARLADLDAATPALAKLLAAVSASDALHAAALGDTGPIAGPSDAPPPSASASPSSSSAASPSPTASVSASARPLPSSATAGLQSALAAEHAAVYGYGVVGSHLPAGPQHDNGWASYAAHEARRDFWQRRLDAGGASPTAAAAGYRLPFAVTNAATAARLAAYLETQLTATYADLVAASTGELRATAAQALRETALRARHWGADLSALPGLPDAARTGSSPSPSA